MILQIGELLNVVSSTNIFRKTKAAHFTSGVRFFCSRKKTFLSLLLLLRQLQRPHFSWSAFSVIFGKNRGAKQSTKRNAKFNQVGRLGFWLGFSGSENRKSTNKEGRTNAAAWRMLLIKGASFVSQKKLNSSLPQKLYPNQHRL